MPELVDILEVPMRPLWVALTLLAVTLALGLRFVLSRATRIKQLTRELEEANRQLRASSVADRLTGVYNRAHLLETLPREISRSRRHGRPLSCLILSLDRLESINERFGRFAGDEVLMRVASALKGRVRQEDVVVRFGGEEFLVLLPDSSAAGAVGVAEDLRRAIAVERFDFGGEELQLTASVGLAELAAVAGVDPTHELVELADAALYMAKEQGRDRVVTAHLKAVQPAIAGLR